MTAILDIAALLVMPFLMAGLANRVKAVMAGRRGPSLFQPFFDFWKLLRKGEVVSRTTTFIFRLAPTVSLAAVFAAALFTPLASGRPLIAFDGDFIAFAYLLGLGKFLSLAASLDTGSSFEGMGSAREASFSVLVEPGFFLLAGTLALVTGRASFAALLRGPAESGPLALVVLPLAALALFLMLLVEACRGPVDDPATHLELTMIHEVMVLDNSGPDLAFIQLGNAMKMTVLASLIAALFRPLFPGDAFPVIAWFLILFAAAALVGLLESVLARMRMTHVPQFIFVMSALGLIALFTAAFALGGGRP